MYNKIINPITKRKVNINSKLGKKIFYNYLYTLNGGTTALQRTLSRTATKKMDPKDSDEEADKLFNEIDLEPFEYNIGQRLYHKTSSEDPKDWPEIEILERDRDNLNSLKRYRVKIISRYWPPHNVQQPYFLLESNLIQTHNTTPTFTYWVGQTLKYGDQSLPRQFRANVEIVETSILADGNIRYLARYTDDMNPDPTRVYVIIYDENLLAE